MTTTTRKLALVFCCVCLLLPAMWAQAATLLNYGQPVSGTLNAGEQAEYSFEGRTGEKPVISMNAHGGSMSPAVELYDPQGRLIGEDDGSGPKGNALLQGLVLPVDGTYTVKAINKADSGSGEYGLLINEESHQIFFDGAAPGGAVDKEAYTLAQPWNHTNVTYSVYNSLPNFSQQDVLYVIALAFQSWSNVAPISFTQVQGQADINIQFAQIDGPSNILGETCPPYDACGSGSVTFDSDEAWTMSDPQGYGDISFLGVASHEFGHAIGLLHTDDQTALMYPTYSPYNLQPARDDAAGAQRLYGQGSGTVSNPPSLPGLPPNNNNQMQVSGEINDQTYTYFWDFDVVAGDTVTIKMSGSSGDLDSFIVLIDGNNNLLAYDDDHGGGRDARLANLRFPQAGTYTIAATRYAQAQGYTEGQYILSIEYDVGTAQSPPANATSMPPAGGTGTGTVSVSAGDAAQFSQLPSLDTVLSSPFANSVTPSTQQRSGNVVRSQAYGWELTWCATDAQTLQDNLANMTFMFAVNGQAVDPEMVGRNDTTSGGLSCAQYFVTLSNWTPGSVVLTSTIRVNQPVFDGQAIYAAGDYFYQYNLNVM